MNKHSDAIRRIKCSIDSVEDINNARTLLASGPLTQEMYDKLNVDGAMDALLGEVVLACDLENADKCSALRTSMNSKLCQAFLDNSKSLRAALEDFTYDLLEAVQMYDSNRENNSGIRSRIAEFEARLDDGAKQQLAAKVMEYMCFNFSNATAICDELCNVADFIDNNCDNDSLKAISEIAGSEMSDDQKFYLNSLNEKLDEVPFSKNDLFDMIDKDRQSGQTFEQLGFTAAGVKKIAGALTKAENKFFKSTRALRELIIRDTSTDESITKKNALFYAVMDRLCHFVHDGAMCCRYLAEQVNLMAHEISMVAAGVAKPETTEDDDASKKEPSTESKKAQALERGDDLENEDEGTLSPSDPETNEPGEEPVEQTNK